VYELEEMLDWTKTITGNGKTMSLTSPIKDKDGNERYRVREGLLNRIRLKNKTLMRDKSGTKKNDQLYVILLSDMLLFCRPQTADNASHGTMKRQSQRVNLTSQTGLSLQVDPLVFGEFTLRNVPDEDNGIGTRNID